jgi:hypothetical protein
VPTPARLSDAESSARSCCWAFTSVHCGWSRSLTIGRSPLPGGASFSSSSGSSPSADSTGSSTHSRKTISVAWRERGTATPPVPGIPRRAEAVQPTRRRTHQSDRLVLRRPCGGTGRTARPWPLVQRLTGRDRRHVRGADRLRHIPGAAGTAGTMVAGRGARARLAWCIAISTVPMNATASQAEISGPEQPVSRPVGDVRADRSTDAEPQHEPGQRWRVAVVAGLVQQHE